MDENFFEFFCFFEKAVVLQLEVACHHIPTDGRSIDADDAVVTKRDGV